MENLFIEEEIYQEFKGKTNKKDDYLTTKELMDIQEFVKERIKENENLFESEELETIKQNATLIKKIYLLGGMDSTNAILGGAK